MAARKKSAKPRCTRLDLRWNGRAWSITSPGCAAQWALPRLIIGEEFLEHRSSVSKEVSGDPVVVGVFIVTRHDRPVRELVDTRIRVGEKNRRVRRENEL